MTNSVVLLAYEINAQTAKQLLQKRAGFGSKFKKFKTSEIVEHVMTCWHELEKLLKTEVAEIEGRILYTAKLSEPLRIGQASNDILNNSFLMSALVDNNQIDQKSLKSGRYYQYKENSDFEKKQFSILLEEARDHFSTQEVGIFGWVSISSDDVDIILKNLASKFSPLNAGELHFIEFTREGEIFPNFSNVKTQKFEGKLAGNYALTLQQSDYQDGINRINDIAKNVTQKIALNFSEPVAVKILLKTPQESGKQMTTDEPAKRNKYSNEFKREIAKAAQEPGATLSSVGDKFGISPTLVRNWKIKFSENNELLKPDIFDNQTLASEQMQVWLQKSTIEGTIDSDGDLYVVLETTDEIITNQAIKLFIVGKEKLSVGTSSISSNIAAELITNERNWLRSDFLKGIGTENKQFSYNIICECHITSDTVVIPVKLKNGKVAECPIKVGDIEIFNLKFISEDDNFRAEGSIKGPNGFIYAAKISSEEPEAGYSHTINKVSDDENSAEMYEYLWDAKKGDTVYIVISAFEKIDGKISCGFIGEAQIEEPISYDDSDDEDFDTPKVDDFEIKEGDIGLFEFQIKRGLVDEDEIDDDDVQSLVDELKNLCDDGKHVEACKLLLPNLSFEFDPSQLDDDPDRFFADTDYVEFECSDGNTSVKISNDDGLVVTISVMFEIPLNSGISTTQLAEYLPESGAWSVASASPGWIYAASDGDNVWFTGVKP